MFETVLFYADACLGQVSLENEILILDGDFLVKLKKKIK